jgi:hypothetical protein
VLWVKIDLIPKKFVVMLDESTQVLSIPILALPLTVVLQHGRIDRTTVAAGSMTFAWHVEKSWMEVVDPRLAALSKSNAVYKRGGIVVKPGGH